MDKREAIRIITDWRWDDSQMPLPLNQWGFSLALAIDIVTAHADTTK